MTKIIIIFIITITKVIIKVLLIGQQRTQNNIKKMVHNPKEGS